MMSDVTKCDEDEYMKDLVLVDDDGDETEFRLWAEIILDNRKYQALAYIGETHSGAEDEVMQILLVRVDYDEKGVEFLSEIEDDYEWQRVYAKWEESVNLLKM